LIANYATICHVAVVYETHFPLYEYVINITKLVYNLDYVVKFFQAIFEYIKTHLPYFSISCLLTFLKFIFH